MNREKTVFILHGILILAGVFLGIFSVSTLPSIGESIRYYAPEYAFAYQPALIWAWSFFLPIFMALFPLWKIFSSIETVGGAFVRENVGRLRTMAFLAFLDALIFPIGMFVLGSMGASQPGLTFVITPFVLFLCSSVGIGFIVLSNLVEEAVKLREDNELTI